jgi:pimeloyl-ACP methyl ester carboxylesterase/membrane protein DedA with SNARE-associated domain
MSSQERPANPREDKQTLSERSRSALWLGPIKALWSYKLFRIYFVLLVLSHVVIAFLNPTWPILQPEAPEGVLRETVEIRAHDDDGPVGQEHDFAVSVLSWEPSEPNDSMLPVIFLHGSPTVFGGLDFKWLAPELSDLGRHVYALDRPGYGDSSKYPPRFSAKANARFVLAAMDDLGIERAHIAGWSFGGAIGIWMGEIAPERVASLSLIAATAVQEGEGSGEYHFEHFKYRVGYGLLVALPEVIPHFGLLGPRWFRHAFVRDFMDTDQRELSRIVPGFEHPVLIVHGREDKLVPATTAELHHDLLPNSRLVMLESGHIAPVYPSQDGTDFETTVLALRSFLDRHDAAGRAVLQGQANFAPVEKSEPITIAGREINPRETVWWLMVLIIILGTFISEDLTVIAVGLLLAAGQIDYGVAALGCFMGIVIGDYGLWAIGRFGGTRLLQMPIFRRIITEEKLEHWGRVLGRHTAKAVFLSRMLPGTRMPMYIAAGIVPGHNRKFLFWVTVAVSVWTPLLLILTGIIGPQLLSVFERVLHGPWAILAAFVVLVLLLRIASLEATEIGRARLRATIQRVIHPEFWPMWIFYAPLVPWLAYLSIRHRSLTVFTCANPGIPNGGGVVGEPKSRIIEGFTVGGAPVLPAVVIAASPNQEEDPQAAAEQRTQQLLDLLEDPQSGLGGFPVVLKPNAGQRGYGVRIIESKLMAMEYFEQATGDVIAQHYDRGPCEFGVFWLRDVNAEHDKPMDERPGYIFSVTRKAFPTIRGDGESSLEQLIWRDRRYRLQGHVFQKRHESRRDLVLQESDLYQLARAGNHAQGTKFLDGADLITPELTAWAEQAMQSYRDPGGRLDFGRLDVRCPSEEDFRAARNLRIVECNGTLSESTNMYDPGKSLVFTYGTLFRQWSLLYRIGAARRREGIRPVGVLGLLKIWAAFRRTRSGPAVAD